MGVSNPRYYDHRLQGSLSTETCAKLDFILSAYQNNQGIEGLEHYIYDLTPDEVDLVLSDREVPSPAVGTLRPYQQIGAAFMYYAGSCLLGDSVGLGKTAQIAGLVNIMKAEMGRDPKVLFIAEKRPSEALQRELVRFTGVKWHHAYGTKESLNDFIAGRVDFPNLVTVHSALRSPYFQSWLQGGVEDYGTCPYDLIVVDESSVLGNSSTAIYKAAKKLFAKAPRLVLMNATPFEANLDTFYHQLNLLDSKFLPTKSLFDKTYKVMDYSGVFPKFSGKYRRSEEFRDMVAFRYLPRTRESLGASFENCSAEIIHVPLEPEQRALYNTTNMRRMLWDCPWVIDPELPMWCNKIDKTLELVHRLGSDKVLIYVYYRVAQDVLAAALEDEGYEVGVLNGDTVSSDANQIVKEFVSGSTQILITNVQKSLNFEGVRHCVFYSYNPNPSQMVQFEGRITRSFDIRDKHVYILLTDGPELETFNTTLADRADASSTFTSTDFSLILTLLKES